MFTNCIDYDDEPPVYVAFLQATLTVRDGILFSNAVFEVDGERAEHETQNVIENLEKLEHFGGTGGMHDRAVLADMDAAQASALTDCYDLESLLAEIEEYGDVTITR